MANTLSTTKMTNPIRGLVSKRRIRYTQDGFDLDLTYINDRIIAMGYPAEHMESIYRNKIEDVQKMLEKNHAGCYKIYNLCSERSYDHKRFPYYSVYPFKDHNPPDIELINAFCRDVDEHLRANVKNVVAVHCKAGKGRTGTMICCYLLYSRQFKTADDALQNYAQKRTSDSKGVTIPSQRRYVEYYASLLKSNETYQPVTLYICEIRLTGNSLNIKEGTINVTGNAPQPVPEFKRSDDGGGGGLGGVGGGGGGGGNGGGHHNSTMVAKLDYCMPLAGDVKIEFVKSSVLRKEKRCHFWFNTYFVEKSARKDAEGNLLLALSKSEIDDAHKDKHHKEYPNNFMVEVVLRRVPPGKYSESVSLKKCHPSSAVTTSPLIRHSIDNNRQQLRLAQPHQQQILFQQQQQQQYQHPTHRQEPYWPTNMKQSNNYIDGTTNNSLVPGGGGYQHDQHQHHNQQQQHIPAQQLLYQQPVPDGNQQQYLDDLNHCQEYSGTSSSESSTEEEGWDSGECPTLLLSPEKASFYYRNDNYYYGSCAGLNAGSSDPSSGPAPPPQSPAPRSPTITAKNNDIPTANNSYSSKIVLDDISEQPARLRDAPNNSSSRVSNNSSGSSKLNQSLANTTIAASANSSKRSVVPESVSSMSSGVSSSIPYPLQDLPLSQVVKRQYNHNSSNGKPVASVGPLSHAACVVATVFSSSATTNNSAWSSIGLRRKKKKSFKSGSVRNFARSTRDFGSNVGSACSTGASTTSLGGQSSKSKSSGQGRFNTFRWLRSMRGNHNLKTVLATSGDIMTLTSSPTGSRPDPIIPSTPPPTPTVAMIPQDTGLLMLPVAAWLSTVGASSENPLSTDYYSSICDKQLSFESPSKSPGHLMKLNLTRKPNIPAIPDSECAIVVAKPSERTLKIGFDVSPSQSPTAKTEDNSPNPFVVVVQPSVDKSVCDSNSAVSTLDVPKSLSLAPKSENASFCDRILHTIVSGMSSSRKSSDHDLPIPTAIDGAAESKVSRCSSFSLRELGQELKSVMKSTPAGGAGGSPGSSFSSTSSIQQQQQQPKPSTATAPNGKPAAPDGFPFPGNAD